MPSQSKLDKLYMSFALHAANMSYAIRRKVGAVLVKGDNIISYGWNGTPTGFDNYCEDKSYMDRGAGGWLDPIEIDSIWPLSQEMKYGDFAGQEVRYKLITKPEVLHAESNALMKLLHSDNPVSTKGATLYVTLSPCFECSKLIVQAGINRVVYNEEYRIIDGLEFLKKFSNIEICQLEM
jgi:dCMP deaminase